MVFQFKSKIIFLSKSTGAVNDISFNNLIVFQSSAHDIASCNQVYKTPSISATLSSIFTTS